MVAVGTHDGDWVTAEEMAEVRPRVMTRKVAEAMEGVVEVSSRPSAAMKRKAIWLLTKVRTEFICARVVIVACLYETMTKEFVL